MKEMIYGGEGGLLGVEDIGDGYKLAVVSIAGSHPCAYVQFPGIENLPSCHDIQVEAPVHGGFTFLGMLWHAEEYGLPGIWLGWDYAHLFDYIWTGNINCFGKADTKKWTSEEIRQEGLGVLKAIKEGKYKMRGPIHFVFISLPMSGKTDKEIGHRLCSINGAVKKACVAKFGWNWDDIMTIDNFWDRDEPSYNSGMKVKNNRIFYLGGALQKMSRADAVYFDEGWEHANRCQVERFVALKYDIPVLFYNVEYGGVVDAN